MRHFLLVVALAAICLLTIEAGPANQGKGQLRSAAPPNSSGENDDNKGQSGQNDDKPNDDKAQSGQNQPDDDNKGGDSGDAFVLKSFSDLAAAQSKKNIVVDDLEVPAGSTLDFNLQSGTTITFKGHVTFGFKEWEGPLIQIRGKNIKVIGAEGNLLDGDGKRWWDGKGGNDGTKKPKFFFVRLTDSTVSGLNVKNTPVHGFSVANCKNVVISNINFDNSEGNYEKGAHNTDGFDVGTSEGIVITGSNVNNQDDCLAINSGTNITFSNNYCTGGHGISIGSVGGRTSNVVSDVYIKGNTVADSDNGIRIKTVSNAVGSVKNIVFEDIVLKNIKKVGVTIQGNYLNGGPKGDPTSGVPITGLKLINVKGNVLPEGTNQFVWVANAADWSWDSAIEGGTKTRACKGFPDGVDKLC